MPRKSDENYKNKDFTDYFLLFLNTNRLEEFETAFQGIVNNAKNIEEVHPELFKKEDLLQRERDEEQYEDVNFYDSIQEEYINKPITFRAIVRGEAEKPYVYPVKVKLTCEMSRGEKCATCGLFLTGGNLNVNLDTVNPLELIDCNNIVRNNLIKYKIGVVGCGQFKMEFIEQKYMQELFLSPVIEDVNIDIKFNPEEDERKEERFIIRHAFCKGSSAIPNKTYRFYGIPCASPKNQSLIYFIDKIEEEESDLDTFELSEEDIKSLKIFQPNSDDYIDIENKLEEIYSDFSVNLSPIIRYRNDIMFSCDLTFHSVLQFWFGESYERGWVESLIVGDTQTGKTKSVTKLIKHYKAGVIQGSANSTVAGLIGGQKKFEKVDMMTWGLIPLNNSRLVVLDEMSDIHKDVFKELTRLRSEGIAERTIVGGSSQTRARVRLLWLSNPRKRSVKLYDNGCELIKELIGKEEDISRFDFILIISNDEVSTEKINTIKTIGDKKIQHVFKSDLCNKLVLWAWSRKANNIIFEKDVEKLILHYSIVMSNKYTDNFPLVSGSAIRLKIAKLSIALAARLFSTDESAENIVVKENHVVYIYEFLQRIYNKPNFAYGEYSDYFKTGEDKEKDSRVDVFNDINRYCADVKSFIINMLKTVRITALEVRDFARCDKDKGDYLRTRLVANGFLIQKSGFYVKSELFRKALKHELEEIRKEEGEK